MAGDSFIDFLGAVKQYDRTDRVVSDALIEIRTALDEAQVALGALESEDDIEAVGIWVDRAAAVAMRTYEQVTR